MEISLLRERVDYLFHGGRLDDVLRGVAGDIITKIDAIPKDQFLAASDDQLVEHMLPRFQVIPINLYEDKMEMEQFEATVDVCDFGQVLKAKGIIVDVVIPFTGGYNYFHLAPNTNFNIPPRGYVQPSAEGDSGILHIIKEQANNIPMEKLKGEIDNELRLVRALLGYQIDLMERHNQLIPAQLRAAILGRRQRLEIHNTVPGILGIPLKRKAGAPNFDPLPIQRKLIRPLPPAQKPASVVEPGIAESDYQHILSVIRHEGRTFEATPKTYAVHDEEELRDIMLAHLNGHYQGEATGEAFRKSGKTDIRIEDGNRAAFVAECKIWRGGSEFTESIDQLLRYLTWRDSKDALVIFNKHNAKFTEVLLKISELLKHYPKFIRELAPSGNGEWKAEFSSAEDEKRLVTITVFAFNIFVQPK